LGQSGLIEMIVDRKMPAFLDFTEAGLHGEPMPVENLAIIVKHFIGLGYRGILHFHYGYIRGEYWEDLASAKLWAGGLRDNPSAMNPFHVGFTLRNQEQVQHVRKAYDYCAKGLQSA
jgi:hypothetical protein